MQTEMKMDKSSIRQDQNVNEVLAKIGEFGRFQKILVAVLTLMNISIVIQPFFMFFGTLVPSWKCNTNSKICTLNGSFPADDKRRCNLSRQEWHYLEKEDFSLVTEFNIDCNRKWILSIVSSAFFVGEAFSAIIFGKLADTYGRKKFIFLGLTMVTALGGLTPLMANIHLIVVCRFLIGIFYFAARVQSYIMVTEFVGTKHRPLAAAIFAAVMPVMWMFLALQAYYLRNWKIISYINNFPYIIFLSFYFFVPESIRWLKVNNRKKEVIEILQRIAHSNRVELAIDDTLAMDVPKSHSSSYCDVFRYKTTQRLVQCYLWVVITLSFFSMHVAVSELGGSVYLNFVLVSMIEIPVGFLMIPFCTKYGRKKSTLLSLLLTGVSCFIIGFLPGSERYKVLRISIGVIGKGVTFAAFSMLEIWSTEIFPTNARAKGIGIIQVCSRMGSICSPWVSNGLKEFGTWIPFALMGVLTICGSMLGSILPETKNHAMRDFIEDEDKENNVKTSNINRFDNRGFNTE